MNLIWPLNRQERKKYPRQGFSEYWIGDEDEFAPRCGQIGADDRKRRRQAALPPEKRRTKPAAEFAKPSPKARRKRSGNAKPIPKTALKTVKALNKRPNFRMFDTYGTPFLFDWPGCAPTWHYARGNPHLVRKPRHCSGNHASNAMACRRFRAPCQPRVLNWQGTGASRHSPSESPAEPSYEVVSAADQVAITKSMLEKRRIDREIEENEDWFRDRQRRQATAEAVERQRTEDKLAEQRRLRWVHQWTQYALDSLPYDARRAVEMEVHTKVVEAFSVLQPTQPEAITQRLVDAAVHRAIGPWTRKQEIERALKAGMNNLAWDAAVEALRRLREEARDPGEHRRSDRGRRLDDYENSGSLARESRHREIAAFRASLFSSAESPLLAEFDDGGFHGN